MADSSTGYEDRNPEQGNHDGDKTTRKERRYARRKAYKASKYQNFNESPSRELNPQASNFNPRRSMQGSIPESGNVDRPYSGPQHHPSPFYFVTQYPVVHPVLLYQYLTPQIAIPLEAAHEYLAQNPSAAYQFRIKYAPYQTDEGPKVNLPMFGAVHEAAAYHQLLNARRSLPVNYEAYNTHYTALKPGQDRNGSQVGSSPQKTEYVGYGFCPKISTEVDSVSSSTGHMVEDLETLSPPVKPWMKQMGAMAINEDMSRIRRMSKTPSF